ncbi:MAG: peptidoglycan editing factor PgeF [Nitrospinae bacterium]|nr:peptidoglycan editing factor PgeF [Nitrospinota bacterium]
MRDRYIISNRLNEIGNIAHAFTTRFCGDIEDILENLTPPIPPLAKGAGHPSSGWVGGFGKVFTVKQVHGDSICVIDSPLTTHHSSLQIEADAIITNMKSLPIGVFTADCLPVILADVKGRAVGIVHAGRVGISLEISKKTVNKMKDLFDIKSQDIIAAIGPGISECCYEVDDSCINPFKEKFSYWKDIAIKKDDEKWMLDIKKANRMQLIEAGLKQETIFTTEFCTSCHNDRFFSYRREGKNAGRMLTFVAIKE